MDTRYLIVTSICTLFMVVLGILEWRGVIRNTRNGRFVAVFDFCLVALNLWAMYMHCSIWGWQ